MQDPSARNGYYEWRNVLDEFVTIRKGKSLAITTKTRPFGNRQKSDVRCKYKKIFLLISQLGEIFENIFLGLAFLVIFASRQRVSRLLNFKK